MRALVVRAGALGDLLLLRGAFAVLRKESDSLHLLCPAAPGGALLGPGGVDAVLPLDGAKAAGLFRGEASLGERFGRAVVFTRDRSLQGALSPSVDRIITADPQPPPGLHAADYLASVAGGRCPSPPLLRATPEEEQEFRALGLPEGGLLIHPGSGSRAKNWPAERFAALADRLSPGRDWLLLLGPADADDSLSSHPRARRIPRLSLRMLGRLLSGVSLFVGNDSGVSHLAGAWGAPTLALFGPTDPLVWAPRGPRVKVVASPSGSMEDLAPDAVEAAARHLLKGS